MRLLGFLLLVFGIGSFVVHFMNMESAIFTWIGTWGENPAWAIRAAFVVLGLLLLFSGKPKTPAK